jgi:hypothetical protein
MKWLPTLGIRHCHNHSPPVTPHPHPVLASLSYLSRLTHTHTQVTLSLVSLPMSHHTHTHTQVTLSPASLPLSHHTHTCTQHPVPLRHSLPVTPHPPCHASPTPTPRSPIPLCYSPPVTSHPHLHPTPSPLASLSTCHTSPTFHTPSIFHRCT